MQAQNVLNQIDNSKRCGACQPDDHYHATYVGPAYADAKVKILFIGLDAGADSRSYDLHQRRAGILDYYGGHNWNQQYRGCVKVASYIIGSGCSTRCASRCTPEKGQDCVLRSFAQGNAVKCVPADAADMTFRGHERVEPCLQLALDEVAALRPDVIVLQGRNSVGAGDPYRAPFFRGVQANRGTIGRLYFVNWADGSQTVVLSFNHPSRGNLEQDWDSEIAPALNQVRQILAKR